MIAKETILEAFHFRHACKEFDSEKKISNDDFQFILETARLSPSSFGFEPWKFLVVQNPELRKELMSVVWGGQKSIPTCSHFVIVLVRKSHFMHYSAPYIQRIMRETHLLTDDIMVPRTAKYKNFQENDFQLTLDDRHLTDWAGKQCYLALANMMTSAALIGIDSCPIEGYAQTPVNELVSSLFNVDLSEFETCVMVAFGYRKNGQRPKTRNNLEDIVEYF